MQLLRVSAERVDKQLRIKNGGDGDVGPHVVLFVLWCCLPDRCSFVSVVVFTGSTDANSSDSNGVRKYFRSAPKKHTTKKP